MRLYRFLNLSFAADEVVTDSVPERLPAAAIYVATISSFHSPVASLPMLSGVFLSLNSARLWVGTSTHDLARKKETVMEMGVQDIFDFVLILWSSLPRRMVGS